MDDADDGEVSRAPELEDLIALCRRLNDVEARYLVIGGFAVILHGFARGTKDIDLLVDPAPDNIALIRQALSHLADNAVQDVRDSDLEDYPVVRVVDEIVVDLMAKACGIDYREAASIGIQSRQIEGVPIPIAGRELLIRTKQTIRPSDAADVAFLSQGSDLVDED